MGLKLELLLNTAFMMTRYALLKALNFVVLFVTTRALGPEGFAVFKLVQLVPTLSKYSGLGLNQVTMREVYHLHQCDGDLNSWNVRNTAYSFSMLTTVIMIVILLPVAWLLYRDYFLLVALGSLGLVLADIGKLALNDCRLRKDFRGMARAELVAGAAGALFVVAVVSSFGVVGRLIGELVISSVLIALLFTRVRFSFRWALNSSEVLRQLKIAVPLFSLTFLVGVWIWLERISVTYLWGISFAGAYFFAVAIIEVINGLVASSVQVLSMYIYERMHKNSDVVSTGLVLTPTMIMSFITSIACLIFYYGAPVVLEHYFADFLVVKNMTVWIALCAWLYAVQAIVVTALTSEKANMQVPVFFLKVGSIVIHLGICFACYEMGFGVEAAIAGKAMALFVSFLIAMALWVRLIKPSIFAVKDCFLMVLPGLVFLFVFLQKMQVLTMQWSSIGFLGLYLVVTYMLEKRTGVVSTVFDLATSKIRKVD